MSDPSDEDGYRLPARMFTVPLSEGVGVPPRSALCKEINGQSSRPDRGVVDSMPERSIKETRGVPSVS